MPYRTINRSDAETMIQAKLAEARNLLSEVEQIADHHDIEFSFFDKEYSKDDGWADPAPDPSWNYSGLGC